MVAILIGASCWIAYFGLSSSHRRNRRIDAARHLEGILSELHVFSDSYNRLPHAIELTEDGSPMHSWRFLACRMLFGDMVQCQFYGQGTESAYKHPWDSPTNRRYYDGPHLDYGGSPASFIDPGRDGDFTRFLAITGPDTAFNADTNISMTAISSDLVIVAEVKNSSQHWMKPGGDLQIDRLPHHFSDQYGNGISSIDPQGFLIGFAGGEVWMLSRDIPFEVLAPFLAISGAGRQSKEQSLAAYRIHLEQQAR